MEASSARAAESACLHSLVDCTSIGPLSKALNLPTTSPTDAATPSMAPPSRRAIGTTTTTTGRCQIRFDRLENESCNFTSPIPLTPPPRPSLRRPPHPRSGLQQQFVLFSQATLDADPTVLLDPNALSDDGTVALRDVSFSDDGSLLAYQVG